MQFKEKENSNNTFWEMNKQIFEPSNQSIWKGKFKDFICSEFLLKSFLVLFTFGFLNAKSWEPFSSKGVIFYLFLLMVIALFFSVTLDLFLFKKNSEAISCWIDCNFNVCWREKKFPRSLAFIVHINYIKKNTNIIPFFMRIYKSFLCALFSVCKLSHFTWFVKTYEFTFRKALFDPFQQSWEVFMHSVCLSVCACSNLINILQMS